MSRGTGPLLSDLELRYPFAPQSRKFFESIPLEEGLASAEVIDHTELRLMDALGRSEYEPHISDLVEFLSFFGGAFVASQDPVLTSRYSKKEAEKSKVFFSHETVETKVMVVSECFGVDMKAGDTEDHVRYQIPFEKYLALVSKYELGKMQEWKLVRQSLSSGVVYMSDNLLNDFFGACARAAVADGVRNLRRASFPRQLATVKSNVMRYVPAQRPRVGKEYEYAEDLLKHPVSDGRHRLVWLVLAPYLVNVKKLEDEAAIDRIRAFVAAAGETSEMKRFVEYNVRRARRNGLLPPRFSNLRTEHPDIYGLLPKEILTSANPAQKAAKR